MEAEGEESLLTHIGEGLQADILVAPHHGSATSSSEAFVQAVRPRWVIFSTGYRNRYGFPKTSVVERWHDAGADTINSANTGAVGFQVYADRRPPQIWYQRERKRRYWLAE